MPGAAHSKNKAACVQQIGEPPVCQRPPGDVGVGKGLAGRGRSSRLAKTIKPEAEAQEAQTDAASFDESACVKREERRIICCSLVALAVYCPLKHRVPVAVRTGFGVGSNNRIADTAGEKVRPQEGGRC